MTRSSKPLSIKAYSRYDLGLLAAASLGLASVPVAFIVGHLGLAMLMVGVSWFIAMLSHEFLKVEDGDVAE